MSTYWIVKAHSLGSAAISKPRAGRVGQRRDASQNWATLSEKFLVAFRSCELKSQDCVPFGKTTDGGPQTAVSRRSSAVWGLSPVKVIPRGRPPTAVVARKGSASAVNSHCWSATKLLNFAGSNATKYSWGALGATRGLEVMLRGWIPDVRSHLHAATG